MNEWDVLTALIDEIVETCPKSMLQEAHALSRRQARLMGVKEGAESIWREFWTEGAVSPETNRVWADHMASLHGNWQSLFSDAAVLQDKITQSRGRGKSKHHDQALDRAIAVRARLNMLLDPRKDRKTATLEAAERECYPFKSAREDQEKALYVRIGRLFEDRRANIEGRALLALREALSKNHK